MVGADGFEPPTSCSQSRRATRLRYAPTTDFASVFNGYRTGVKQRLSTRCNRGGGRGPARWSPIPPPDLVIDRKTGGFYFRPMERARKAHGESLTNISGFMPTLGRSGHASSSRCAPMSRIAVSAILLLLPALPAAAQEQCHDRKQVTDYLADRYREEPVAMGLANNGGLIEVLTSPEGGTWTIMITMPDGRSCMVAAGESWQELQMVVTKVEPKT